MADSTVERLGAVEVLTPEGDTVALASLWSERPILLALIRHFG
jgi:hypothetical protein